MNVRRTIRSKQVIRFFASPWKEISQAGNALADNIMSTPDSSYVGLGTRASPGITIPTGILSHPWEIYNFNEKDQRPWARKPPGRKERERERERERISWQVERAQGTHPSWRSTLSMCVRWEMIFECLASFVPTNDPVRLSRAKIAVGNRNGKHFILLAFASNTSGKELIPISQICHIFKSSSKVCHNCFCLYVCIFLLND